MQVLEISYFSFKRMENPNTIYSIFSHVDVKNSWIGHVFIPVLSQSVLKMGRIISLISISLSRVKKKWWGKYFGRNGIRIFFIPLWFRRKIFDLRPGICL
uniref:Uncharacterized protein n=1 Tax=Cacopsylla melanoneura TaxID=428564 RepID=A0A8D8PQ43_9HEMI